jgi:hypothetical protein
MNKNSIVSSNIIQIPGTLSINDHYSHCEVILSFSRKGIDPWDVFHHALRSKGIIGYERYQAPYKSERDWIPE